MVDRQVSEKKRGPPGGGRPPVFWSRLMGRRTCAPSPGRATGRPGAAGLALAGRCRRRAWGRNRWKGVVTREQVSISGMSWAAGTGLSRGLPLLPEDLSVSGRGALGLLLGIGRGRVPLEQARLRCRCRPSPRPHGGSQRRPAARRGSKLLPGQRLERRLHPRHRPGMCLEMAALGLAAGAAARRHLQGVVSMSLGARLWPPDGADQLGVPGAGAAEAAGDGAAEMLQGSYQESGIVPGEVDVGRGIRARMRTPVRHLRLNIRAGAEGLSRR